MVHMRNGREVYPSSMALESFKVTMGTEIGVDEYSSSKTYAVGDYCIYTNTIYKCKTAITTPEAFNSSKWDATSIANELMSTKQSLSGLQFKPVSGQAIGTNELALPSEWDELVLQIYISSINAMLVTHFLRSMVTDNYINISLGNYGTSYAVGSLKASAAKIGTVNWGGTVITPNCVLLGFYKKY